MKRGKRISLEPYCGSCAHFVPHYVPLRGPRDNQFLKCSCGHCMYHTENGCYSSWTMPCKNYQPGYEPATLRLKRHAFQR